MRVSTLLFGLVMAFCLVETISPVPAEVAFDSPELGAFMQELDRRDKNGECKYLDEFTDRNLGRSDAAGMAARLNAAETLRRASDAPALNGTRCRFHDRKAALRMAIDYYWSSGEADSNMIHAAYAVAWLEAALGGSWREKLAVAGVLPAAEDLVALNLSCFRKDGARSTAFWDWLLRDPNWASPNSRDSTFDYELSLLSGSWQCKSLAGPATSELACYWNMVALDMASKSPRPVLSSELFALLNMVLRSPRGAPLAESMMAFAEQFKYGLDDPPVRIHLRSDLHKLIAEGCAAALPATAMEELGRRAAKRSPDSVESLIAEFK